MIMLEDKKVVYIVNCKDREELEEMKIILPKVLNENKLIEYREISETFIYKNEKWILSTSEITKLLVKRKNGSIVIEANTLKEKYYGKK